MKLAAYRRLLADRQTRRFLAGLGVSALGDGLSIVTIAWLAVVTAPAGDSGIFVGIAVAAYTLPGVIGAIVLRRYIAARPARELVLGHAALRAACLGLIAVLSIAGALPPYLYVALLAGSSLLYAWGNAGEYTMLSALAGPDGRLAVNSLASAQVSFATIVGPVAAGVLLFVLSPGALLALDAGSFAVLGLVAWRTRTNAGPTEPPVDTSVAESGFRLLRRRDLLSLTVVTWVFFFLYGPVEVALPVYVAHDQSAPAGLLGVYWTSFGVGALVATLVTGALRARNMRRTTLLIVAGWGACLLPFAVAPIPITVLSFALGGLIYGPFIPLTYALFQSATPTANLPAVLAARSAVVIVSTPLGTAIGGPLVASLGATGTLVASGIATIALAAAASVLWRERSARAVDSPSPEAQVIAPSSGRAEGGTEGQATRREVNRC
jgi:predicted MFS family arabinose efflux permease